MNAYRNYIFLLSVYLFTFSIGISQAAIIADHNSLSEFNEIPGYWLEKAKELRVHMGSTSHGTQILAGMVYLEDRVDKIYNSEIVMYASTPTLPSMTDPAVRITHQSATPAAYWATEDGIAGVMKFLDSGLYDISGFFWCGEINSASSDYIQLYLQTMEYFEAMYPDMIFIYSTGPTNGGTETWHRNTEMIRQYCAEHDKLLFDFADIESWDPGGTYYPQTTDACEWCVSWCSEHPEDCLYLPESCNSGLSTCCAHSHGYNCYIKAKAFWWMLARLAGWSGCPAILGDLDGNCSIDIADFGILSDAWLLEADKSGWNSLADIAPAGGDNKVDILDFSALSQAWLKFHCSQSYPGDFNGDCRVDTDDLNLLAVAWLSEQGQPEWNSNCDVFPSGGDGSINFMDFTALSQTWREYNCTEYPQGDFNEDCQVNIEDLSLLAVAWLSEQNEAGWNNKCDIIPSGGDGKINIMDFSGLSENWLGQQK